MYEIENWQFNPSNCSCLKSKIVKMYDGDSPQQSSDHGLLQLIFSDHLRVCRHFLQFYSSNSCGVELPFSIYTRDLLFYEGFSLDETVKAFSRSPCASEAGGLVTHYQCGDDGMRPHSCAEIIIV